MIFRLFLFFVVVLTFFGCVTSVPKTDLNALANIRIQYSKCNKISGRIASGNKKYDLEDLQDDEITGTQKTGIKYYYSKNEGLLQKAKIILREIENSNAIELNQGSKSKYIFVFAKHGDSRNVLWSWLTVYSLGIIPTKQSEESWMSVQVFDSNGKLVYESESIKIERDIWGGWFRSLFFSKEEGVSHEQFVEKTMPIMMNDLINTMVKNNILDCKN